MGFAITSRMMELLPLLLLLGLSTRAGRSHDER